MRYQIPQFIEVEDKIFGPLTLKQFLYVAGGVSLAFIFWEILPKAIGFFVAIPILILFLAFAFYQYNDRPFIIVVENAFRYFTGNKLYVWHKEQKTLEEIQKEADNKNKDAAELPKMDVPKLSDSKLTELSWSLDINENIE
jgi:hypothetical protein